MSSVSKGAPRCLKPGLQCECRKPVVAPCLGCGRALLTADSPLPCPPAPLPVPRAPVPTLGHFPAAPLHFSYLVCFPQESCKNGFISWAFFPKVSENKHLSLYKKITQGPKASSPTTWMTEESAVALPNTETPECLSHSE